MQNILIVDDEGDFREMVKQLVTGLGYSCHTAMDAIEALELIQEDHFDLVISDIRMKGMDGLKLAQEARSSHPDLEFIIMTGHADDYSYPDIIKVGAADFIIKPFSSEELQAKLDRIEKEKKTLRRLHLANDSLKESNVLLQTTLVESVNAMASALEMRDPYTAGHQRRVADIAGAIARKLGLPAEQLDAIRLAALIHDIGKIFVPSEILMKPSRLKEIEMALIMHHCEAGFDILKGVSFPWPIDQIVLQHHEKMDGSGYPQGLRGEEILLEARVIGVADVVEAMSSHRPYRPSLGLDIAMEEIARNRGTLFDKNAVDACRALFADSPSMDFS